MTFSGNDVASILAARLSSWAGLSAELDAVHTPNELTDRYAPGYRLTSWPDLKGTERTAVLLGALSFMSQRPVTPVWLAGKLGCDVASAGALLERLVAEDCALRICASDQMDSEAGRNSR